MLENPKVILLKEQMKSCFHFYSRTSPKQWKFSTNIKREGGMSTQRIEDSNMDQFITLFRVLTSFSISMHSTHWLNKTSSGNQKS